MMGLEWGKHANICMRSCIMSSIKLLQFMIIGISATYIRFIRCDKSAIQFDFLVFKYFKLAIRNFSNQIWITKKYTNMRIFRIFSNIQFKIFENLCYQEKISEISDYPIQNLFYDFSVF